MCRSQAQGGRRCAGSRGGHTPAPVTVPAANTGDATELGMKQAMREWRSRPVPQATADKSMSPQMAKLLGCDTPEGQAKYDRLRAYREAGYNGPLDQDNNIPDPDDPAEQQAIGALADMRARSTA